MSSGEQSEEENCPVEDKTPIRIWSDWLGLADFRWLGKEKWGWAGEWRLLCSAPLNMMLMDAEEHLKTTWKRQWRKAISGDPEKRVRDHMSDPRVQRRVKLYDTASFTFGVLMVLFAEYLMLTYPSAFPAFYLFTFSLLTVIRYLTYKSIKNQYFLLDFCYFVNVSTIFQSLTCSAQDDSELCASWFKSNFVLSHGPIAVAIIAWQNSLVFHSIDKMTSFFIHIMPGSLCYMQRWNVIPDSVPEAGLSLGLWSGLILPLAGYLLWQVLYLYVQVMVIDHDPELVTSLRYLTQSQTNPAHILIKAACVSLGVFEPGETYNPEENKTKAIFVIGQLVYVIICLLPVPLSFHFRWINTTYLMLLFVAGTWRGGSYYVFKFSKTYNMKFEGYRKD